MAQYNVKAPTGETYKVTAPDGASDDQVLAYARANYTKATPSQGVYRFQGPDGRVHRAQAGSPQEAQAGLEAMWAKQAPAPSRTPTGHFDVEAARRDGVSEAQIADYLGRTRPGFDLAAARRDGVGDARINSHLAAKPIQVRGPDGATVNFPAGTSRATMETALRRHYGGPAPAAAPSGGKSLLDLIDPGRGPRAALADARQRSASTPGLVRAASQAVSFNTSDEMDARLAQATTAARNLLAKTGMVKPAGYTGEDAYGAVMQSEREAGADFAKAHPVQSLGATLAGSLVGPGMLKAGKWAMGAKTLPRLMGRSALVGGAAGAAYGAGGAEDGHRVEGAVAGGAVGAALGAAAPPIAAKLGSMARGVAAPVVDALSPRIRAGLDLARAKAGMAPAKPSAGAAARAAARAERGTPAEVRAAQAIRNAIVRDAEAGAALKADMAPMHGGGDNLSSLFEVAAKSPGPARQMIRDAVKTNRAQTFNDVEHDLGTNLNGKGDYFATLDAMNAEKAATAKTAMDQIGPHLVTLDENSISALRSDLSRGALKKAAGNALASTDPEIRTGAANLNRLADLALDKPSAQTMTVREAQDISEALLSAADSAYKGGDGATGKALKGLGKAIRTNARTPDRGGFAEYDDFLKQYATDSQHKRALELGRDAMIGGQSNAPEAVQRELAGMGSTAMEHYRKGVGEALLDKVRSSGGDVRMMRTLLNDRNLASRVRLAFPDDAGFANFMKAMEDRVGQADLNNRYIGGSPTYPLQAARADLENTGPDVLGQMGDLMGAGPVTLGRKAIGAALKSIPKGKSAITDMRANAALGRSAMDPDEMTRLLNMLQARSQLSNVPRIAGAAVPTVSRAVLQGTHSEERR